MIFKISWVAWVVTALSSGLATADEHELKMYAPVLEDCYRDAIDRPARQACQGKMSEACMAKEDGGYTTLGMVFCISAEADVWDRFLNTEYQATLAWAKAADEDEAVYFPEFARRVDALRSAQRSWIEFRDAECGLAHALWGAGSMRNIAHASCRLERTAQRTLELREKRELFE